MTHEEESQDPVTWEDVCRKCEEAEGKDSREFIHVRDGTRVAKTIADLKMVLIELYASRHPDRFMRAFEAAKAGEPITELMVGASFTNEEEELIRPLLLSSVLETPEGLVVGSPYARDERGRPPKRDLTRFGREMIDRLMPPDQDSGPQR
ncbi:hypothetical protein KOR34_00680 [Posidoniimonas corsicana]|uniref:Uncharacterized protein n=1 Tax=Posidoniimonas corsicana TaxID=1938618 RepID=A0A5C5VAZ8_9BACT|nr:hypothetical protein KOR34_00680 [Posidoniimonas corsicana]